MPEIFPLPERRDPRAQRTQQALEDALLNALNTSQPWEAITVKTLAKAAGVTRKTFYSHFSSLEALAAQCLRRVFGQILPLYDAAALTLPWKPRELMKTTLRDLAKQRRQLGPLLLSVPSHLALRAAQDLAETLLDRALQANDLDPLASAPRAYLLAMIGGVVHGMLYTWAERGFQDSPAVLAAIMDSALSEGIEKILLTQTKR